MNNVSIVSHENIDEISSASNGLLEKEIESPKQLDETKVLQFYNHFYGYCNLIFSIKNNKVKCDSTLNDVINLILLLYAFFFSYQIKEMPNGGKTESEKINNGGKEMRKTYQTYINFMFTSWNLSNDILSANSKENKNEFSGFCRPFLVALRIHRFNCSGKNTYAFEMQ